MHPHLRKTLAILAASSSLIWAPLSQAQDAGRTSGFENPIVPGFAPDPSIVRVGRDFYLVNSSFEYFPSIPIYHSRDLVNWGLIGYGISNPAYSNLAHVDSSGGIQAATIRYHNGLFYIVTTAITEGKATSFVVTASDPHGPWSRPIVIADADGIDPSLFFDDDGRLWYVANRIPKDQNPDL